MIIDLDAHQGNGHEKDFSNDSMILTYFCNHCLFIMITTDMVWLMIGRVYTLDMYNPNIYPLVSYFFWIVQATQAYLLCYSLSPSVGCCLHIVSKFLNVTNSFIQDYEARRYIDQKIEVVVSQK